MLRRKILKNYIEQIENPKKTKTGDISDASFSLNGQTSPYFQDASQPHCSSQNKSYKEEREKVELEKINECSHIILQNLQTQTSSVVSDNIRLHIEDNYLNLMTVDISNKGIIEEQLLNLQRELNCILKTLELKIPPVEYIYNPLEYAFNVNEMFVRRYCRSTKKILLVGMNPGPFGMCQTGVPFGDPVCVKEFLQIEGTVFKPKIECPYRKILGFSSSRREQSGQRLWNFFKSISQTPENVFKNAFLCNFCPIALMKGNGCNVTPADIKNIKVRKSLEEVCEVWYLKVIQLLQPEYIIAIGSYIDKKTKDLFKAKKIEGIKVFCMPHPSPRALHNQNWNEKAQKFLSDHNLTQYFC